MRAEEGTRDDARRHFDRGVQLFGKGDLDQAVVEFETAHRLQPHFAVLYNLGQTHAAMGHPAEAVAYFRRYLEEGETHLDEDRRRLVEAAIALHERRIGTLELVGDLEEVECEIDGKSASCAAGTLPLSVGHHVIVATRPGFEPQTTTFDVPARATVSVHIELQPKKSASSSVSWLRIACPVPDVRVRLDAADRSDAGELVSVTPGRHTLGLTRRGYTPRVLTLDVPAGGISRVDCGMVAHHALAIAESGIVDVAVSESDAEQWVDGGPYRGQRLPAGRHRLAIQRAGFYPWSREIVVSAQQPTQIVATLSPTPEFRERYESAARVERALAYASAATGVVAGAVALGLFLYNSDRVDDWKRQRAELVREVESGVPPEHFGSQLSELNREEARILWRDDASYALTFIGGVLVATGTSLFIWGKDPTKYQTVVGLKAGGRTKTATFSW